MCFYPRDPHPGLNAAIRLISPSRSLVRFYLCLPKDEAVLSSFACVGVSLTQRTDTKLPEYILVDSRLCAVKIRVSYKLSTCRNGGRNFWFYVRIYVPTDCSLHAKKTVFYENLPSLSRTGKWRVILLLKRQWVCCPEMGNTLEIISASILVVWQTGNGCWSCVQTMDCFTLLRTSDAPCNHAMEVRSAGCSVD